MNNFQLREQNNITYLVCEPLEQAGFIHAFSTRKGGVSPLPAEALNLGYFKGDAPENVAENRARFLSAIGSNGMKIVTGKQIHSADVNRIGSFEDALSKTLRIGDALITDAPGVLIGVQTADCVPVLIADVKLRAVAAVHAGWRGSLARITEKTIARMQTEFGTQPEDCLVAIGPSASACCYEVGEEVVEQFRSEFVYAESVVSNHKPGGKAHLDLQVCNARQLASAGVPQSNIFTSSLCTMCRNDLFFSYRLERGREFSVKGVGRLLSVIGTLQYLQQRDE